MSPIKREKVSFNHMGLDREEFLFFYLSRLKSDTILRSERHRCLKICRRAGVVKSLPVRSESRVQAVGRRDRDPPHQVTVLHRDAS